MNKNITIIGSGPAGYTAAIYSARAGMNVTLFTGLKEGGQLMDTTDVENYPGFRDGITGPLLMEELKEQAMRFGSMLINSTVKEVNFKTPFYVIDDLNNKIESDAIIISTGAEAKWLGLESEKKFWGKGVSACATCDGFFFKNQDVVVVGGGDTACEETIYLSNICKTVTLLVRSDKMKASQIMQKRLNKENIRVIFNCSISEIIGDDYGVTSVDVKKDNDIHNIMCNGVFIAIGHSPNTTLFKNYINLDDDGYIITQVGTTKTNIDGVFACGDVQDKIYRQAITAAGSGCMAALDCEKYLAEL